MPQLPENIERPRPLGDVFPMQGGGVIDCSSLIWAESGVQQTLDAAQRQLVWNQYDPLWGHVLHPSEARDYLEQAVERLGDQGSLDNQILAIAQELPDHPRLTVYNGESVDNSTFAREIALIEGVGLDIEGALLECVEGVPLEDRVDRFAAEQRIENTVDAATQFAMVAAIFVWALPMILRSLPQPAQRK